MRITPAGEVGTRTNQARSAAKSVEAVAAVPAVPASPPVQSQVDHQELAKVIDKMNADVGTKAVTIPGDTYPFEKAAVNTVTGMVVLVASDKMSEEEAATIAKGLVDHYSYLEKAYPPFSRMGAKALPDVAPLTLHPGAAKAYKAAGLLK